MLGREKAQSILAQVLEQSKAEHTEALLLGHDSALTRFAANAIHQNVAERAVTLRVRAVSDQRVGVASTNELSAESIASVTQRALENALVQEPDPDFPGLPGPQKYVAVEGYYEGTAACSPDRRARMIAPLCRRAATMGLVAAGALETSAREIAIANSNALYAYHSYTAAEYTTVVMSEDSSGYGFALCGDLAEIDLESAAQRAIDKAIKGRQPRPLPAGQYQVVLEPDAAADILGSLGYTSFDAQAIEEKRSFMSNRFGQRVMDERVTIVDDALNPASIPIPFDYEGVAKQKVHIIEKGEAKAVVHDTYTAAKAGTKSTGHGLPAPNPRGPMPTHLALDPGSSSLEEMISGLKEGLLVTRFHYTRIVHPLTVTVTGMTRDGTFYIRNGEIAYPVRNLRFTQSYVEAMNSLIAIGSQRRLCGEYGPYLVPALTLDSFTFTGVTEF